MLVCPLIVNDQVAPLGRPVSVNVTLYRTGENVIATGTGFQLTSNDEVYVEENVLFCVDTVKE